MSLHRVSSVSSYEHVRGSSPARSEHLEVSFNPLGTQSMIPAAREEPLRLEQVSKIRRILQISSASIYCLFAAGIVFGYAALKPVLVSEGVYREYCISPEPRNRERTCYEQELRLNFMFTAAAVATNISALPVGVLLDKCGPRICGITGAFLIAIGSLLFAFAPQLPFDGYIPGYICLALGGPFVFISSFQLSNTFPNHSGLILALLTGAFDSSSAIFLFYHLSYVATKSRFSLQRFFLAYLLVPTFILFVQIFIMPSTSYKITGGFIESPDAAYDRYPVDLNNSDAEHTDQLREEHRNGRKAVDSEITSLLKGNKVNQQQEHEQRKKAISGVWGAAHGRSALRQIKSPWFLFITLFTVVQMTRINYFVATIRTQYEYILHDDALAERINLVFDMALPLGGILSVPFIGLILDNTSTPFILGFLVFTATIIGILGVLHFAWAAYANVVVFVLYRPLYYTAVSDYAAKVFGFQTFGKVYGLIICSAGLLNFSQSALDAATLKVFHGDPIPINIMLLLVALVVGLMLVSYVWHKSSFIARKRLEDEAEDATETSMPNA